MNAKLTIDGEEWPGDYHAAMMRHADGTASHIVVRSTTPCSRDKIDGWHRWIGAGAPRHFILGEGDECIEGNARWRSYRVEPWGDPRLFEYRIEFDVA